MFKNSPTRPTPYLYLPFWFTACAIATWSLAAAYINPAQFADNLELSAQRALTVTRALIDEGLPSASVFAAAFGREQPVASNADGAGRSLNRRVEMAPVPKTADEPSQR